MNCVPRMGQTPKNIVFVNLRVGRNNLHSQIVHAVRITEVVTDSTQRVVGFKSWVQRSI